MANQIAAIPIGAEKDAKAMDTDLSKGIEGNLDAALIQAKLLADVKYSVTYNSEIKRAESQQNASSVPNVNQVVNELQVKAQKATSSK